MSRLSICIVLIAALFAINTLSVVYAAPAQKEPNKATKTVASSSDASSDAPSSTEGTTDEPASSVNPTDGPPSGTTTSDNLAPAESALLPVSSMAAAGLAVLLL
ncbi:hypothetical protein WR25_10585 [Diploscapter pachys]|uniref:Uncharacterized protein n=1 Tax=Diploscapter pachys TaxID=2018661 RepID=A0A2A2JFE8_9BILA|nr:hypothetical protein WR25_10585 [Diploscapter pachys]